MVQWKMGVSPIVVFSRFRYFSTSMIMGEKGRVVVALCSVLGDVFLSSHWGVLKLPCKNEKK